MPLRNYSLTHSLSTHTTRLQLCVIPLPAFCQVCISASSLSSFAVLYQLTLDCSRCKSAELMCNSSSGGCLKQSDRAQFVRYSFSERCTANFHQFTLWVVFAQVLKCRGIICVCHSLKQARYNPACLLK